MNRRTFLKSATVSSSLTTGITHSQTTPSRAAKVSTRAIPSSGELLPVIGLGTWQTFDVGRDLQSRANLKDVLAALVDGGGSVVDSSPMYGSSEEVVGDLSQELGLDKKLFKASKVWTRGRNQGVAEMHRSMQRMNTPAMDLMQVHNLLDADVHIKTLQQWKSDGLVRYLGITHYHSGGYSEMQRLMQKHKLDFIQINYSILDRGADKELLPMAKELGIAVLINRPFETGSLFKKVRGKSLPVWSQDFDCNSWGQFFLKYILADSAVTCLIPGTSKRKHMVDNLGAGRGALPTPKQRKAMLAYISGL